MIPKPSLRLRLPPAVGTGLQEEFTKKADRYWHSVRADVGFWEAEFWMPLDTSRAITPAYLRWWFDHQLGARIEEASGSVITWEGIVWSMELTLDGITRRKQIEDIYNRVRADYTDESGAVRITNWYTDTESQARYGTRELIVPLRLVSSSEAQAAAQRWLKETAFPRAEAVRVGDDTPGLLVTCRGDMATANYQYVDTTAADLTTGNISAFVSAIVANDCEFLSAGRIDTNTLQRKRQFDRVIRCYEGLVELTELGDSAGDPWHIHVGAGGLLHYEQIDTTPKYYWYGLGKGLETTAGALNPWAATPGVMRDMLAAKVAQPASAWLQDSRDIYIEEVRMAHGQRLPTLKPGGFDANEILSAKNDYERWLEMEGANSAR